VENILLQEGISNNLQDVKSNWINLILPILQDSSIHIPTVDYMQTGSCKGIHTENLGHILSEMQYLQRAYPDAKW
jgi:ring-1,2-phenylacetyl-CoA epoxidase subunit PaaC